MKQRSLLLRLLLRLKFLRACIGPHGKFIATGLSEVKTTATRKQRYRLDDFAASPGDFGKRCFDIVAVENPKSGAVEGRRTHVGLEETAVETLPGECRL